MEHQCFADIQSAHPHGEHEMVVGSIYFDPDHDLVGEQVLVEDLEGLTCLGEVIEQDRALILVALDVDTMETVD